MFYGFQFLLTDPHTNGVGKKKHQTNRCQDLFRMIAPICNFFGVTGVPSYLQGIHSKTPSGPESTDSTEIYIYIYHVFFLYTYTLSLQGSAL